MSVQYRGQVLGFEETKKWFEERRYKSRNHRTLYHNHLKVRQVTDADLEALRVRLASRTNVSAECDVPLASGAVFRLEIGETYYEARWRLSRNYNLFTSIARKSDWINDEESLKEFFFGNDDPYNLRPLKDLSLDTLRQFYSEDGYAIGWDATSPLLFHRPDGSKVISSGGYGLSPGVSNVITGYSGERSSLSGKSYWASHTNALIVVRNKKKNLIVSNKTGTVNLKGYRCYECNNARHIPSVCIVSANSEGYIDTNNTLRCVHGYTYNHEDWTRLVACANCGGDPTKRGRRVYQGLIWSGLPVILDKDNNVIQSLAAGDASTPAPVHNLSVFSFNNSHLGVPDE